jgi:ParB-like chromosome segregation protein Spo0J
MDINRSDDRYFDICKSVKKLGFVGPVRAKVTEDDHVVVIDGHNRLGVALDMSLREVPVWIADKDTDPDDLKAPDSGLWQKSNKPWTANIGK